MPSENPDTDPVDASIPYVRNMEIFNDAEDVKRVRFSDETTAVEVGITDDTMIEFVEVAEDVFDSIHADMTALRDEFNNHDNNE